jgi:uroporphyrinogen decarboxylase
VQNWQGSIVYKAPGANSIPAEIDHLLKDRTSWEEHYKPRLQWSKERFHDDWWSSVTPARFPCDGPQGLHCGSLIGMIRDTLGVVGLSYLMLDDEDLLDEMIQTVSDLCFRNVQAALASGRHFDFGHFWEDICFKTGPLVNPRFFSGKIGPHYKRITDELHKHGIKLVSVDSDGMIDHLVPIWLENGVNTMNPIEVGTWHASIKPWREKYGKAIRGVGGVNKNVFALDRAAVDAEIERLRPLVALGGYLPSPDHLIPPTARWDNVQYYCERMRIVFG